MFPSETPTELNDAKVAQAPSRTTRVLAFLNHHLQGYFPALGALILAMVIHTLASLLVGHALLGSFPFCLYLSAFLVASWCGYGPGLLVTILITCAMPYLFKPDFSIRTVDLGGVIIFLLLSVILSSVASRLRQSEATLRRMNQELDRRVAEQTKLLRDQLAELRRANSDLEQFAFSASHDLQEPLRNVAIYSQMLKKKFGGMLGPEGDEYIGYTVEGALRMKQLVDDLLTYTRTSSSDAALAPRISAKEALAQALSNLQAVIVESHADITAEELPSVQMRKVHLVQLFQNLISNSIKYRKQEPRIHISAVPHESDSWLFAVKDNGIGIDPEYHEKVFGVFKRLHRRERYPGTGIGLAICKRIVEQHGGRIWVNSKPDEGATFLFTLPAEPR